jgi:hypothetical protein
LPFNLARLFGQHRLISSQAQFSIVDGRIPSFQKKPVIVAAIHTTVSYFNEPLVDPESMNNLKAAFHEHCRQTMHDLSNALIV